MLKYLFILFFVLFPFYLGDSGLPQFSHIVLISIVVIVMYKYYNNLIKEIFNYYMPIIFMIYILFVNAIWFIGLNKISLLVYSSYYIFNIILFYIIIILWKKNIINTKLIIYSVSITLVIQLLVAFLFFEFNFSKRLLIFFNNPNQLGYFALAIANIYFIVTHNITNNNKETIRFYNAYYIVVYAITLILITYSASKAAMISYVFLIMLIIYYEVFKKLTLPKLIFSLISFMLFIILLIVNFKAIEDKFFDNNSIITRIVHMGQESDDSLAGRGYDRIVNHPTLIIFGAGEGDFTRFVSKHYGEIHSTIANILFSYGITGLILFILIFYKYGYSSRHMIIMMMPLLLYSLSHNGIRSPLFWIAFALAIVLSEKKSRNELSL